MTVLMHPLISSSFNTTPGPPSCRLDGPFSFPEHTADIDEHITNALVQECNRQVSPSSYFSVASAPQSRNDENISPSLRGRRVTSARSPSNSNNNSNSHIRKLRNRVHSPHSKDLIEDHAPQEQRLTKLPAPEMPPVILSPSPNEMSVARYRRPSQSSKTAPSMKQQRDLVQENSITKVQPLNHSHYAMRWPKVDIASCAQESRHKKSEKQASVELVTPISTRELISQQHSDRSSAFVHSMRSTSFTNMSLSIFPRSSRLATSTDSCMLRASQPRCSMDSDRPLSSSSVDEIAMLRGFKRQQIIDELISTEEAYVGDLKALTYLYSTLLTSSSSIPGRLRLAIEENVASILHMHEKIVQQLYDARLHAAARRWADTAVLQRLGHVRRSHLRCSDRALPLNPTRTHHYTKSDESSDARPRTLQYSIMAEPVDVLEITSIFKNSIGKFIAYEEYCANFESIAQDLQRSLPQLWPTYESGMESLARAVMALDRLQLNGHRSITVSDLLIKPIQRLTKYPLLLEQLLNSTPVADAPDTHGDLEEVLLAMREMVQMVNLAREDQFTRHQIQKRQLLQHRLDLTRLNMSPEQFRALGHIELCGILHVAYQTTVAVNGGYALCALIDEHFLLAFPARTVGRFKAVALIQLSDIKLEKSTDGKGLQCASTVFTWKICFACAGIYHELILSGCSKIEEDHWTAGLKGDFLPPSGTGTSLNVQFSTCIALDLKSAGVVFSSSKSLSRESSMQRAATVGGRPSISQVIVRNTHNVQDLQELRDLTSTAIPINRSQSHMSSKRIPVLDPKRSERTRLESSIGDIWTKERLPYPGMVGSRGGQIIRASAGTLARKLSLASIHTPFSKGRTSSLSMTSRQSYDLFNDSKSTFDTRRKESVTQSTARMQPRDLLEENDMRIVVGRMIGANLSSNGVSKETQNLPSNHATSHGNRKGSAKNLGPGDPATVFYESSQHDGGNRRDLDSAGVEVDTTSMADSKVPRWKKKRWSNPILKLKEFGSEAKSILYSS